MLHCLALIGRCASDKSFRKTLVGFFFFFWAVAWTWHLSVCVCACVSMSVCGLGVSVCAPLCINPSKAQRRAMKPISRVQQSLTEPQGPAMFAVTPGGVI